jgi:hypothetical protein
MMTIDCLHSLREKNGERGGDMVNMSHKGGNNNDIVRGSRDAKELSDAQVHV